ncbi:hypothetical protein G5C51_16930 [Streptomyces sp. A7024]|uniref:Uncharacterized protein n=1 Tax=Streptomyces coryli TaxID=1128680 RepID=A0A6G4U1J4_9ACTN|nr:hypothetical protein [Streptomyces coryli]NGN65576.1 hypothetical protein [Streptomyces coryli]
MTRRTRRLSVAGISVLAAAGLATGASGALAGDAGDDKPAVHYVVNEEGGSGSAADGKDCPGDKQGGRGSSDAASEL